MSSFVGERSNRIVGEVTGEGGETCCFKIWKIRGRDFATEWFSSRTVHTHATRNSEDFIIQTVASQTMRSRSSLPPRVVPSVRPEQSISRHSGLFAVTGERRYCAPLCGRLFDWTLNRRWQRHRRYRRSGCHRRFAG